MYIKNLKITSSFKITNRGIVCATDLDYDSEFHKFSCGDIFRHQDKIYEIKSIEVLTLSEKGVFRDVVAFVVKEISVKEMFNKLSIKLPSPMAQESSWSKIWKKIKNLI